MASSNIGPSSTEPGRAAQEAEKAKLTKYQELERDPIVIPVAQENIGPLAPLHFLKDIGDDRRLQKKLQETNT